MLFKGLITNYIKPTSTPKSINEIDKCVELTASKLDDYKTVNKILEKEIDTIKYLLDNRNRANSEALNTLLTTKDHGVKLESLRRYLLIYLNY